MAYPVMALPTADRLPVEQVREALREALASGTGDCVVLHAPTGSGKSTKVPQMLLDSGVVGEGRRVVVLQPRRIAARLLARRVAWELGCKPGETVGYHVRFDRAFGVRTRILFITEGILLGMLADDPLLSTVGALVFDEFHERHLQSDLGIALARLLQRGARPDLRIVVMSATLDVDQVAGFLAPCAVLGVEARQHPVEVRYAGEAARDRLGREREPVWERAAAELERLAAGGMDGHTLVFMPGAYEIARTVAAIQSLPAGRRLRVLPLHGGLSPAQQDAAVEPSNVPKVIVATNVAETSLTIDGVTSVIDSGLARVPRYDPRRGIDTLLVEKIDRASADQRAGRAGRTSPGRCIRLWSEASHTQRPAQGTPEVARVDLAEAILALKAMGHASLETFPWLEAPAPEALERAEHVLADIGALDADGRLTETGLMLRRIPAHPRVARLLLEGRRNGVLEDVACLAALLQGRPLLERQVTPAMSAARERHAPDAASDVLAVLALWQGARDRNYDEAFCREIGLRAAAAREADRVAAQFAMLANSCECGQPTDSHEVSPSRERAEALGRCLVAAFADHVALRDNPGTLRCSLTRGRRGELRRDSAARDAKLLVACEIEETQRGGEVVVLLSMASAIERAWIEEAFPGEFEECVEAVWDSTHREVVARRRVRFRGLVLDDQPADKPDPEAAAEMLARRVCSGELVLKGWTAEVDKWIDRVNFLAAVAPDLGIAAIDEESRLMLTAEVCEGATAYRQIKERLVLPTLKRWLTQEQQRLVEEAAPVSIQLPGRSRPLQIRYEPHIPRATVAAKLQDFYDVPQSRLTIVFGRVPLTVELLAPNGRPAQITNNLDAFWTTSYPLVRKELKGRYPKHEWR